MARGGPCGNEVTVELSLSKRVNIPCESHIYLPDMVVAAADTHKSLTVFARQD